jgi:hypothetical protein
MEGETMIRSNIDDAKRRVPLPSLMERLGLAQHSKKSALCPFHDDEQASFSIWESKGGWLWKCHTGCGKGDEIDFLELHNRIPRNEATKLYLEMASVNGTALSSKARESQPSVQDESSLPADLTSGFLSTEDCHRAVQMAIALREDPKLCERIAGARGWKTQTIRDLTCGPHFGWYEGKLAFIYESGVKLRWRQDGERIVRWAFGKPWLWRGSLIFDANRVYLCEGETDAISLIDAGVELDGRTVAVALPSASTFDQRWAKLFAGKEVILVLDADKAGQDATRRVSRLLQPHVASLKQLNWGGLQHAS